MRKSLFAFALLVLLLTSCAYSKIQYQPKEASQASDTIERVIRSQPPWGSVPYRILVKNDCVEMVFGDSRKEWGKIVCYNNIGIMDLYRHRSGVWSVEIYDTLGYWLYSVSCYKESDAKALIDALHTMKGLPK